jgi:hypothetical protein
MFADMPLARGCWQGLSWRDGAGLCWAPDGSLLLGPAQETQGQPVLEKKKTADGKNANQRSPNDQFPSFEKFSLFVGNKYQHSLPVYTRFSLLIRAERQETELICCEVSVLWSS